MLKTQRKSSPLPVLSAPGPPSSQSRTLLHRVSSRVTSFLSKLSAREAFSTATTPLCHREEGSTSRSRQDLSIYASEEQFAPQITTPRVWGTAGSCPHAPHRYHSFPELRESHCDLYGIKAFSGPPYKRTERNSGERSKSRFSDITLRFTFPCKTTRAASIQHSESEITSVCSHEHSSQIIPARTFSTKVGRPRYSPLPAGHVPVYPQGHCPSKTHTKPTQNADSSWRNPQRHLHNGSREIKQPTSPRLHHLHGLPHSGQISFVHKHEVRAHLAAVRSGAPSPLRQKEDVFENSSNHQEPTSTFVETVFYGSILEPPDPRKSLIGRAISPTNSDKKGMSMEHVQGSGGIVIQGVKQADNDNPIHAKLQQSTSFQIHSSGHSKRAHESQDLSQGPTTIRSYIHTPQSQRMRTTIGSQHLELKGGGTSSFQTPRLRGGDGGLKMIGDKSKFNHWILTCPHRCTTSIGDDLDSIDSLFPRVLNVEQVARIHLQQHKSARVPKIISRNRASNRSLWSRSSGSGQSIITHQFCLGQHPPASSLRKSSLPRFQRGQKDIDPAERTHTSPNISLDSHRDFTNCKSTVSNHFPIQQGDPGSPSPLDTTRMPPTLYWLAGGQEKPVSIDSWQKQMGKKRMGGLFGMAVYGSKAGTAYVQNSEEMIETRIEADDQTPSRTSNGSGFVNKSSSGSSSNAVEREESGAHSIPLVSASSASQSTPTGSERAQSALPNAVDQVTALADINQAGGLGSADLTTITQADG